MNGNNIKLIIDKCRNEPICTLKTPIESDNTPMNTELKIAKHVISWVMKYVSSVGVALDALMNISRYE